MKVQAKTYPDNLGHQAFPGYFRCHDGAHFRVVKGRVTNERIPSTCATCHTFPQVGASISNPPAATTAANSPLAAKPANCPLLAEPFAFPIGAKPADHKDELYVFSHKKSTLNVNPVGTTCGTCHTRSYCVNCHESGAVKVQHTQMLYSHASAIIKAGGPQSCAYCHQAPSCARCHEEPVLQARTSPPARLRRQARR